VPLPLMRSGRPVFAVAAGVYDIVIAGGSKLTTQKIEAKRRKTQKNDQ